MFRMRSLLSGVVRSRPLLLRAVEKPSIIKRMSHDDGFPAPFSNMPFNITNRYLCTAFFAVVFGVGLWAPFIIVWYSMAKKTL